MNNPLAIKTMKPRTREHYLIEIQTVHDFSLTRSKGHIMCTLTDGTKAVFGMKCWTSHINGPKNTQRDNMMKAIEAYFTKQSVQIWVTSHGYVSDVYS